MSKKRFGIKIEEAGLKSEDRSYILTMHNHINELKKLVQTKDESIRNIIRNEIKKVRRELNDEFAHKFYFVTVNFGPHKKEQMFSYYPTTFDINDIKISLQKELRKNRQYSKEINKVNREFNGLIYQMIGSKLPSIFDNTETTPNVAKKTKFKYMTWTGNGRVFETPNSILNLTTTIEYAQRIRKAKKPYDRANYVGVELELVARIDQLKLNELFVKAKLAGNVYVKHDGSIKYDPNHYQDQDTQYPHEITLIAKEEYINDVINKVCAVLNSKEVDAYVNNTCGLHVHLDMRNRDPHLCYKNMYHSLDILKNMVPRNRLNNRYCIMNNTSSFDDASSRNPDETREARYQAINAYAYNSHRTLEVRIHSGSTNAKKINNWVNILMSIVQKKEAVDTMIKYPEDMVYHFGVQAELIEYIKRRTKKFENSSIDNKQDHFDQTA